MILIKNAQVFAPKALGKKDVLLAYDKILEIADCIEPWRDDLTVIDAAGKMLVPGFIDQHVHIVGGGGEGGFETRTPEFQLSKAVTSGVTTLVGLLGTDGYTKSPELLLAKTKALNNEGITAYCLTNSYAYPPRTITGSVANDILYISEIIGCKLAIADHSSSPARSVNCTCMSVPRLKALSRSWTSSARQIFRSPISARHTSAAGWRRLRSLRTWAVTQTSPRRLAFRSFSPV